MFEYYRNHKFDGHHCIDNSRKPRQQWDGVPEVCVPTELDDEGDDFARDFGLEYLGAAKQWNSEHKAIRVESAVDELLVLVPVLAALRDDTQFIFQVATLKES